jgi:hypothetical protein
MFAKNPDLVKLTSKENTLSFLQSTVYAPLTSVEVERSFSMYKNLLTDNRQSLKENSIRKYLSLQFNNNLNE